MSAFVKIFRPPAAAKIFTDIPDGALRTGADAERLGPALPRYRRMAARLDTPSFNVEFGQGLPALWRSSLRRS
jgi:hypothetical protein